ncbi:UDP-N-acetylmuramoyl-L-alanine--D-glutamate ligase [uncultured Tateyamaria sp.]|uniref:UDP-N-acetylmuramoyl-L-alanine--D-glutamate ligase n=1 Tax=uncultured Tateyamaria sp. TaxID=455651 RepID=UPI002614ED14|nr:UDP-N-acetylmuramoyl-L-alanine--D-glutamate ligase [uncultured Tateyamaria sp.]
MIVIQEYAGRRVGVLGMGRSGLAAAAALEAGGAMPVCWDDNEAGQDTARQAGFTVEDLTRQRAFEGDGLAALIVSPGIPHLFPQPHKAVEHAWSAQVPVDNDIGLFFREMFTWEPAADDDGDTAPVIIAVTGSNGKSTCSALINHIFCEAGREVQLGGNIGVGVLGLTYPRSRELIVLELSSYQTELARHLSPDIAVFLNLSDDHLDRHAGRGGYFAAKQRLFRNGPKSVIGVDEVEGRALQSALLGVAETVVPIASAHSLKTESRSVFYRKNHLVEYAGGKQVASFDMREASALRGAHNAQNAAAAYAACRLAGLGPRQIEPGLRSFPGLAHRLEQVAEIGGVRFVNDSKATNVDAAEKSLLSFDNIRWIVGGKPKDGGITALLPLMERVKKSYLIGDAAEAFSVQLAAHPYVIAGTLEQAVTLAAADAGDGDTVLLAPACASFDQFSDFEARGDAFRHAVNRLGKADGS